MPCFLDAWQWSEPHSAGLGVLAPFTVHRKIQEIYAEQRVAFS